MPFQNFLFRVGVSYYDASIRQLHVLEVWEDGSADFPLIDLGTSYMQFVPCSLVQHDFVKIAFDSLSSSFALFSSFTIVVSYFFLCVRDIIIQ